MSRGFVWATLMQGKGVCVCVYVDMCGYVIPLSPNISLLPKMEVQNTYTSCMDRAYVRKKPPENLGDFATCQNMHQ